MIDPSSMAIKAEVYAALYGAVKHKQERRPMGIDLDTIQRGDVLRYAPGSGLTVLDTPAQDEETWLVAYFDGGKRNVLAWEKSTLLGALTAHYRDGELLWSAEPEKPEPPPFVDVELENDGFYLTVKGHSVCPSLVITRHDRQYRFWRYICDGVDYVSAVVSDGKFATHARFIREQ